MRFFSVRIKGEITVAISQEVIDAVDDEWRDTFYGLHTPEDIAEMVAYNLAINRWPLSQLDGWADQPDENARVLYKEFYTDGAEELEEDCLM